MQSHTCLAKDNLCVLGHTGKKAKTKTRKEKDKTKYKDKNCTLTNWMRFEHIIYTRIQNGQPSWDHNSVLKSFKEQNKFQVSIDGNLLPDVCEYVRKDLQ